MAKRKTSKRAVQLRVTQQGALVPADALSRDELRARKLHVGEIVSADPVRPRNPQAWSRAHKLAQLLIENVDRFRGKGAHEVLKRLQYEADIGCEHMMVHVPGVGESEVRWPQSLAFDQLDEGEFQEIYGQFCQHIIDCYWPDMDENQIDDMANLVGMGAM